MTCCKVPNDPAITDVKLKEFIECVDNLTYIYKWDSKSRELIIFGQLGWELKDYCNTELVDAVY